MNVSIQVAFPAVCMSHVSHTLGEATTARCLKITEKVLFNIASEVSYARYVYILSGQKFIKNGPFWQVFENLKLAVEQCYQTCQF